MSKISICVPTYEMKGKGVEFLRHQFKRTFDQTYKDWEVIVSDQSNDSAVKDYIAEMIEEHPGKFKYVFSDKRGSIAENLNNAMKYASGDYIKFLLQDDFFYDNNSLEHELKHLGDYDWGLAATIHWDSTKYYWHLVPEYTHNIYTGGNTIGSPSLLLCKKENALEFDPNLVNLVDCDYYRMMYDKYGWPKVTPKITTVSRVWEGQHQRSNEINETRQQELDYATKKHNGPSVHRINLTK